MTTKTVYVDVNSEVGRLMASMRQSEEKEIYEENQKIIQQIDEVTNDTKLESTRKLELYCNVVAHLFQSHWNWKFMTEGRDKRAQDHLASAWKQLSTDKTQFPDPAVVREIRDAKLQLITKQSNFDKKAKDKWDAIVIRLLPI